MENSLYYPRVKFLKEPLSLEIEIFSFFLFQNSWGWEKDIFNVHPKLKEIYNNKNPEKREEFLKRYIQKFERKNRKEIEKRKKIYQKEWRKIEKDMFSLFSKIIETEWPKEKEFIRAMLSINPICPRFLEDWSFSVFYNFSIEKAMEVIAHECCHFLYFKKIKEIYPKIDVNKFEAPAMEWHLSEIIALIILNDERVQKLLKKKADFYKEHQAIKINGGPLPEAFEEIYNNRESFTDFIKKAENLINKHGRRIKKIS